ncbi:toll/interleukin-1 receptor domain-containing protein [Phormidesmis priestleyi]
MTDVFLSYSRKDKAFVQTLHDALRAKEREIWVDWQAIPLTADWWQEIERGIEGTNTFVFVISPDSVASDICRDEIDHAVKHNKRLVPIVHREGFEMSAVHEALRRHNWLFFQEEDCFEEKFQLLLQAIETDFAHVQTHTRLLTRAVEWNAKGCPTDLLMRGNDLQTAIHWLTESLAKDPKPTLLQNHYVVASQQEQEQERQHWKDLYEEANRERRRAETAEIEALNALSQALSLSHDQLGAIVASTKAVRKLLSLEVPDETKSRTLFRLWETLAASKEKNRLQGHESATVSVCFNPTGQMLATADADGSLKLWHPQGKLLKNINSESITEVCFSPSGRTLALACRDGVIKLLFLNSQAQKAFAAHEAKVTSLSFSPDGRYLVSGSGDHTVKLWRIDGTLIQTLTEHQAWVTSVRFSPDGKTFASASADKTIKLWSSEGVLLKTVNAHQAWVTSLSFSRDGHTLASASVDHTVKLWRLDREPKILKGHQAWVTSVSFSSDGQMIASASTDGAVNIWRSDGSLVTILKGHHGSVTSLSFSPDGQTLATASDDKTVRLWSLDFQKSQPFEDSTLNGLLIRASSWLHDYLQSNPNVSEIDRRICDITNTITQHR